MTKDGFANVDTNDTSQERVDKTSESVHEPEYLAFMDTPQSKSLSDEEILTYKHMIDWTAEWSYINFARAIEAAHGIKGNT